MPLKVLVIDNNAAETTLVNTTLGAEGYDVATAPTLDEGLSIFRNGGADLVLLSSEHSPESVDAWWAEAQKSLAEVPIVLIGATRAGVPNVGAVDTPIDTRQLVETVRNHVGASEPLPATNWLPDELRESSAEMAEMERLMGWTATPEPQAADPVGLGIFSPDEAPSTVATDTPAEAETADSPSETARTPALDGTAPPAEPETAATGPADVAPTEMAPAESVAKEPPANAPTEQADPVDALDLPETAAVAPEDDADDAMSALETLEVDHTDGDDREAHQGEAVAQVAEELAHAFGEAEEHTEGAPDNAEPVPSHAGLNTEADLNTEAGAEAGDGTHTAEPPAPEAHVTDPASPRPSRPQADPDAAFPDAVAQQVSDDIDAAFAAFDLEGEPATPPAATPNDDDEGDEVLAEELMADELIATPPAETAETAETAEPAYSLNDAAEQAAADIFSAEVTMDDMVDHAKSADSAESDDLLDSLSNMLDRELAALEQSAAETAAPEASSSAAEPAPADADADTNTAEQADPMPVYDATTVPGQDPLAGAVMADGTVPLGDQVPPRAPVGSGPAQVVHVTGGNTDLPDNIAGLPIGQVERIIADVARQVVEQVVWETVPAMVAKVLSERKSQQDRMFTQIVEKAVWECLPALAESKIKAEIARLSED